MHLRQRALRLQHVFDQRCHLGERLFLPRLDVGDFQNDGRECALDDLRHLVLFQRERRGGNLVVDQFRPAEHAQIEIGRLGAELDSGVHEILGLGQRGRCSVSGGFVGKRHLIDAARLGNVVTLLVGVVGRLDIVGADLDLGLGGGERKQQHAGLALLGRHEQPFVGLVELLELGIVGLCHFDRLGRVDRDVLDDAGFAAVFVHQIDVGLRRGNAGQQAVGQLFTDIFAPAGLAIARFGHANIAQGGIEARFAEFAAQVGKIGIGPDAVVDRLHRDCEA